MHYVTCQSVVSEFGLAIKERVAIEVDVTIIAGGSAVKGLAIHLGITITSLGHVANA